VAVLEDRVAGEVAAAVALIAERPALADKDQQREIAGFALVGKPFDGFQDVLARGGLALAFLVGLAEQEADVGRVRPESLLAGEQIVKRFGILLGVRARLDLLIGVFADSDDDDARRRFGGWFLSREERRQKDQSGARTGKQPGQRSVAHGRDIPLSIPSTRDVTTSRREGDCASARHS
jgi:hypothetical protein